MTKGEEWPSRSREGGVPRLSRFQKVGIASQSSGFEARFYASLARYDSKSYPSRSEYFPVVPMRESSLRRAKHTGLTRDRGRPLVINVCAKLSRIPQRKRAGSRRFRGAAIASSAPSSGPSPTPPNLPPPSRPNCLRYSQLRLNAFYIGHSSPRHSLCCSRPLP